MEQDDLIPPFTSTKEMEEFSKDIEDIDKLATKQPEQLKPYQENFIEEKSSKSRIAESQESTRSRLAITIIGIYGATILACFIVIGYGLVKEERKEILTLIITSKATLIGSSIGFYFGKNQ
jgi:hypothetical protein